MKLSGSQWIAGNPSSESSKTFRAANPATGESLDPEFREASKAEIDAAVSAANAAFDSFRNKLAESRADFLETIAEEVLALGDPFLRVHHRKACHRPFHGDLTLGLADRAAI